MNYVSTLFIFRYYAAKNYRYVLSSLYFYSFLFTKNRREKCIALYMKRLSTPHFTQNITIQTQNINEHL